MKIKVCHFVNIITGKADGVYTHLRMIFKYVDPDKFQQYLVFHGNPQIEKEAVELGVKVCVIKSLNKKFSIKSFMEFYSFVKSEKIDIIHTHLLKPYTIGGITNIFLRKKMIFNYHGLFINNLYNSRIEKIIYRICHFLIYCFKSVNMAVVPSFSSKKILMQETKLFPDILVYYNGYDDSFDEQPDIKLINYLSNLKQSLFLVGIVARINKEKRIDIVLDIAKRITQVSDNIYFIIMGNGDLWDKINHLLKSMGLENKVNMLGYVPNAKLYIKYFDLLLFSSDWEGLPLSLWEAMAAGVPIVSTDVGGIKEILENEMCGAIYPKGNIDMGTQKIMELLFDKSEREQMGRRGENAIKFNYNKEAFSKFFNSLYINSIGMNKINNG